MIQFIIDVAGPQSPFGSASKEDNLGYIIVGAIAVIFVIIAIILLANRED